MRTEHRQKEVENAPPQWHESGQKVGNGQKDTQVKSHQVGIDEEPEGSVAELVGNLQSVGSGKSVFHGCGIDGVFNTLGLEVRHEILV